MKRSHAPRGEETGICQYGDCDGEVPDGISIQLCPKHLRHAYAGFIITEGLANAG